MKLGVDVFTLRFNHLEPVFLRNRHHLVHVHGQTMQMHDDDGLGFRRDRSFDFVHVNVHGIKINIHENRNTIVVQNTGGR